MGPFVSHVVKLDVKRAIEITAQYPSTGLSLSQ